MLNDCSDLNKIKPKELNRIKALICSKFVQNKYVERPWSTRVNRSLNLDFDRISITFFRTFRTRVITTTILFFQIKICSGNMDRPIKEGGSYSIVPINTDDKETVADFLRKFFFRDEPLNVAIRLLEETESATKLENYCIGYLQFGKFTWLGSSFFYTNI